VSISGPKEANPIGVPTGTGFELGRIDLLTMTGGFGLTATGGTTTGGTVLGCTTVLDWFGFVVGAAAVVATLVSIF